MRGIGRAARVACACALGLAGCASPGGLALPEPPQQQLRALLARRAEAAPPLEALPTADLPPPEPLAAASGEIQSIPLRWEPLLVPAVAGYLVERSFEPEGPFERVAVLPGRERSRFVDGRGSAPDPGTASLPDGVTAFYRVSAYTAAGRLSAPTEVAQATTAGLPAPPVELRAVSQQPRAVPLSWEASPDPHVTGYAVYRSPTAAGPFELLARVSGRHRSEYVDRDLGDLRVFYYQVAARRASGSEGTASAPVRAVTKPEPLPPIGLALAEQRLGANTLRWEPNLEVDVVEYRLLRWSDGERRPRVIASVGGRSTRGVDASLAADEHAVYAVSALDASGLESAPSEPLEVAAAGYELAAVGGPEGIHLRWNPRGAEGFRGAQVLRMGPFGMRLLGTSGDGQYLDATARPGGRYRYQVILLREDGSRAPGSTPLEVRMPDGPVAAFSPR